MIPENVEINLEWVRTMDRVVDITCNSNEEATESNGGPCSPCNFLNKNSKSTYYCLNCQEYFCASCSETLHAGKQNRDHTVIKREGSDTSNRLHGSFEANESVTCLL